MIADARVQHRTTAERFADVSQRIAAAAVRAGREPEDVTLVAVSKTFPVAAVRALVAAGQRDFGESRAQELRDKADELDDELRWHFVGRLQRNKVKYVVGRSALIHSVDGPDLAAAVGARAQRLGLRQPILLQVNVGDDPAKAGVTVGDAETAVGRLHEIEGVSCEGVMTIPPLEGDPRPAFARLRALADRLVRTFPCVHQVSMGMSRDFEVAVEEGATIVRVGEALFGARSQPA